MTKMTKRETFEVLLNRVIATHGGLDSEENRPLVEFIRHEIELLDNRAKAAEVSRKKASQKNDKLKAVLVGVMEDKKPLRAGEIAKEAEISPQRATAMLTQMVKEETVIRATNKGVVTFTLSK